MLRSAGKDEEAQQIENSLLADAIRTLKDSSTVTDVQLDALFVAEEERVSSARVLAEILLPMLSASAPTLLPQSLASTPSRVLVSAASSHAESDPKTTTGEKSATPGTVPGIADFIDEMLSQDRNQRGSRRSA